MYQRDRSLTVTSLAAAGVTTSGREARARRLIDQRPVSSRQQGMSIPSAREGQLCYRTRIAADSPTSHGATLAPAACTALSSYIPVLKNYEYIIFG